MVLAGTPARQAACAMLHEQTTNQLETTNYLETTNDKLSTPIIDVGAGHLRRHAMRRREEAWNQKAVDESMRRRLMTLTQAKLA